MQRRASAFTGYTIEATDGKVGVISDILFEDENWKLRWFVVDAGSWLFGPKILIHPTSLERPDIRQRAFPVAQTKLQVEGSPDISSDQPVFRQMEQNLNAWDADVPMWDAGSSGGYGFGPSDGTMFNTGGQHQYRAVQPGDPHLRSMAQVVGYHIHALDGDIGHLEDFLVDDETWKIDSVLVDTKNWGAGKHVLVAASEIKAVDWAERYIRIDQTRYNIKCNPSWQEPDWSDHPAG